MGCGEGALGNVRKKDLAKWPGSLWGPAGQPRPAVPELLERKEENRGEGTDAGGSLGSGMKEDST